MKTQIFNFLLVSIVFTIFTTSVVAQNTHKQTRELFETAVAMKTKLPTTKEVAEFRPQNKNQADQLLVLSKAVKLIERIEATNRRMSPRVKANFDRELILLETELGLAIVGGTSGKPNTCHGGCDADYPNNGGGQGWRRFMCKLACITICVGPVCGSGGN